MVDPTNYYNVLCAVYFSKVLAWKNWRATGVHQIKVTLSARLKDPTHAVTKSEETKLVLAKS